MKTASKLAWRETPHSFDGSAPPSRIIPSIANQ